MLTQNLPLGSQYELPLLLSSSSAEIARPTMSDRVKHDQYLLLLSMEKILVLIVISEALIFTYVIFIFIFIFYVYLFLFKGRLTK
jgi:hypothetical protein